jgi:hypothetical protein
MWSTWVAYMGGPHGPRRFGIHWWDYNATVVEVRLDRAPCRLGGTIGGTTTPRHRGGHPLVLPHHHVLKVGPHRHIFKVGPGDIAIVAGDNLKIVLVSSHCVYCNHFRPIATFFRCCIRHKTKLIWNHLGFKKLIFLYKFLKFKIESFKICQMQKWLEHEV